MIRMKMNRKMQGMLDSCPNENRNIIFSQKKLEELFSPKFVVIYDCILVTEDPQNFISEKDFNNFVKEEYTDKTGCEGSVSKTLINHYIDDTNLTAGDILPIAITVMKVWGSLLKNIDSESNFCMFVSCDVEFDFVTIRFHKIREDEPLWLDGDLEEVQEPVGYMIV